MLQIQPFLVNDFRGGMTDTYLGCTKAQYQRADNLLIEADAGLVSRFGHIPNPDFYLIPAVQDRISAMVDHGAIGNNQLFIHAVANIYYNNGIWNTMLGPTGNMPFAGASTSDRMAWGIWNDHLIVSNTNQGFYPRKIYRDQTLTWQIRTLGLPYFATSPTVTPFAAGAANYLYAFIYHYSYQVNPDGAHTITHEDFGPTTQVQALLSSVVAGGAPTAITAIPPLQNGLTELWDTPNVTVYIYRTISNGTVFYYVDQIANGVAIYNDTTADAVLQLRPTLYTTGGTLDYDPPPMAKYVTVANGITWFANYVENSQLYSTRVRQSNKSQPGASNGSFYVDVEEEIRGINKVGIYPIVFTKYHIYRLEGFFDNLGRGGIEKREIADAIGLESNLSVVPTEHGLFFAGTAGFYFTDGFSIIKLTEDLSISYRALQNRGDIYGAYDKLANRIWWGVKVDSSSHDNDTCWILDLKWGFQTQESGSRGVFTTASGGPYGGAPDFQPTALAYFDSTMLQGDWRGYIFAFVDGVRHDTVVDQLVDASLWLTRAIIYDLRGPAFNFGTDSYRKWVPSITVSLKNHTNISVLPSTNADHSGYFQVMPEITYRDDLLWGTAWILWNTSLVNYLWNYNPVIEAKRRVPAGFLRCNRRQARLTNAFTNIENSDHLGTATVNSAAKTVTLTGAFSWPSSSEGYYLTFDADSYVQTYLVLSVVGTVATVVDSGGTLPNGTLKKWVLKGYRKDDYFDLLSYSLYFGVMTDTQRPWKGAEGGNA